MKDTVEGLDPFDFDTVHDRASYGSAKWANQWDEYSPAIPGEGILSLWTADMDFQAPRAVVDRLVDAAGHGIYGYTLRDPGHFEIVQSWFAARHNWAPALETLLPGAGIMPCVAAILRSFTDAGDGVIVQTPVYSPYFEVIKGNGRRLLINQLRLEGDRYGLDLENFELLARSGAKAFILCNPHNPAGHAWTFDELTALNAICERYGIIVISDEIHCDIRLSDAPHIAFASISESARQRSFICVAPTKTFNLAGLQSAVVSVADPVWRARLFDTLRFSFMTNPNYFSRLAFETAYREGGPWLDALTLYLRGNLELVSNFTAASLPGLRPLRPDASFLVWIDARDLDQRVGDVQRFFLNEAKVNMYSGRVYGPGGEGFIRLNIGCARSVLRDALERMAEALQNTAS
ncbi:MAG: pyridoxal phosphate-dependent aminotransferase [Sphingomonadales bacterium]|nr:pyridoxal phosphate-dependent aminotransferase [Sphingomonadales bacterium]